jgi:shikimate dehydrogenase
MTSAALQDIIALLGCPAAGNPAQYLFERAIEAAGLDVRFLTVEVAPDQLADALAGVAAMGFRGCLLSGPLREAAVPLIASTSPAAAFAGAVTLVERQAGPLTGHMTDGRGVVEALRSHIDPAGCRVLVLGAGSRGRATALELALAGAASIVVADPDAPRAAALAEALAGLSAAPAAVLEWTDSLDVPPDVDIIVAAGPAPGGSPPPAKGPTLTGLRGDLVIADLTLATSPSPIASQAQGAGACVVDGLEIHAARTAIDIHTLLGVDADPDMLRDALDEFLS